MKIFRFVNGKAQSAEIPDGIVPIALGCTTGGDGNDYRRITAIDYGRRVYQRGFSTKEYPFPERWIDGEEIKALPWKDEPCQP